MNNRWARLSTIEYNHPELGKVVFTGHLWEARPKFNYEKPSKTFSTLKDAVSWMESLGVNHGS